MKKVIALCFVLSVLLLIQSCTRKQETSDAQADSLTRVDSTAQAFKKDSIEAAHRIRKDTLLDNTARFISGMPQLANNTFSALQNDKYWIDYKRSIDTSWKKMFTQRLSKMKEWEATSFSKSLSDTLTLFYPFSGPDFLHAYYLYPETHEYILAALEPIVPIPALDSIKVKARDQFLDSLNHSLRDIFYKSYFITTHMQNDLKQIKGVLPPLYFFIERSGHELLEQQFITLDSAGEEKVVKASRLNSQKVRGVKLTLRNEETKQIKTLYYFSIDISNGGLKKKPEFVKFVMKRGHFNTFVKSASYLMHNPDFSRMKALILDISESLFQDDTGVPFKAFKYRLDMSVQFYGEYTKPVKDFGAYTYQADLDSAYKASKDKQPLPFSLGYHWSSKIQNYMLVKKSQPVVPKDR